MADHRELLRVLARQEGGRPVCFEPIMSRPLQERLVWRSGETPWRDAVSAAQVIIDTSRICSFDAAVLSFGSIGTDGALRLEEELLRAYPGMLPSGMKVVDAGPGGLLSLWDGDAARLDPLIRVLTAYYDAVLSSPAVCGILVKDLCREDTPPSSQKPAAVLPYYRALCEKARKAGLPSVYLTDYSFPQALKFALEAGFDGIRYLPGGPSFEDCWREYHDHIALLGGISREFLSTAKPLAIHARCDALMELTGGKAMALGSDNLCGDDIPYLGFISLAGYVERHA